MKKIFTILLSLAFLSMNEIPAQHSVAREWNEMMLSAIRKDFARPPVQARNLYHSSLAMYEAWAAYDTLAENLLLGKTLRGYTCPFDGVDIPADVQAAREEAMSFAVYRLMRHRYIAAPNAFQIFNDLEFFMASLGYNDENTSVNYQSGDPAALGNYIAQQIINFGLQDGSNEQFGHQNLFYQPINPPLVMTMPGNPTVIDPSRWQPLTLSVFIDQNGNPIPFNTPPFQSPEWGQVAPFSLSDTDATSNPRGGYNYIVYHDPGPPPHLNVNELTSESAEYKWNHALVSVWSSQLDPTDGVMWDISPASIGNNQNYPSDWAGIHSLYDLEGGGDTSPGHALNPKTGQPYQPQIVPRGDYARVLAEFWADGPTSETPPGHWFSITNYVNDQPGLVKKFRGQGEIMDDLEWDVKLYLTLGGALHDAAITAWGIKGWHDSARPISAIRAMADLGQSSDPNLPSYHPGGLPLIPGKIEVVMPGDPLAIVSSQNIGKIKLLAWRGPNYIANPATDMAGVGWILAENWWPYQRPTFVTPPFAGYISGHSTYSRTAAEVLTHFTGDPFFPGGMGEFFCPKNAFLVFEEGPSVDVTLQWATYRDASDQCSLSRIWGSIHPPVDDVPGRLIGIKIGKGAVDLAESLFYKDQDNDGFLNYLDCDDLNANVNQNAIEICDGLDNNCDGQVDEGLAQNPYFADNDNDGYGNFGVFIFSCFANAPSGYVASPGDCDDSNPNINPGMAESCDGLDNNCNGSTDEGLPVLTYFLDNDSDGFGTQAISLDTCLANPPSGFVANATDCDDADPAISPAATELCDGLDNDCNGDADDGLTIYSYYFDNDGDLFGDPNISIDTCGGLHPSLGYVQNNFDCDDTNADINPLGEEVLDGLDNDCNGFVDDGINAVGDGPLPSPVRLFPNPTNGDVSIQYDYPGQLEVRVLFADGRSAVSQSLVFGNGQTVLATGNLPAGLYFLMATDKNGTTHFLEKLVKL